MKDNIKMIFIKIKNFFTKLFGKQNLMLNQPQNINKKTKESSSNYIENMRLENKKNQTIKDIISITEKSPETLYNLNIEQLNVIDKYYIEKLNKVDEELRKVQNKINIVMEKKRFLQEKIELINSNKI